MSSATAAGLRYVSDATPGIARRPSGGGFRYHDADGGVVRDKKVHARENELFG